MNTFEKALKDSVEEIKENKKVIDQVELIALLGSVSEKEAIDNYSDLDILIILKSNELGSFKRELIFELRGMVSDLSNKHKVKISFLTHTFDDFKNYVDLEYLNHYSWGDVIYTSDKSLKEEVEKIINIRGGLKDNEIRKLMIYNLRHAV
jgi:predicted nucleotidyltransferase